jgi:hypothetical protein
MRPRAPVSRPGIVAVYVTAHAVVEQRELFIRTINANTLRNETQRGLRGEQ